MATIQTATEISLPSPIPKQEQTDYLSLTMAAIQLVNPWAEKWPITDDSSETIIDDPKDRIITLAEVSFHDTPGDCWVVIYDRVYDITTFLDEVNIII